MKKTRDYQALWKREKRHRRLRRIGIFFAVLILAAEVLLADKVLTVYESLQPKHVAEKEIESFDVDKLLNECADEDMLAEQKEEIRARLHELTDGKTLSYRVDPSAPADEKAFIILSGSSRLARLTLAKAGEEPCLFFSFDRYETKSLLLEDVYTHAPRVLTEVRLPATASLFYNGELVDDAQAEVEASVHAAYLPSPCADLDVKVVQVPKKDNMEFRAVDSKGRELMMTETDGVFTFAPLGDEVEQSVEERSVEIVKRLADFFMRRETKLQNMLGCVQNKSTAFYKLNDFNNAVSNITAAKTELKDTKCEFFLVSDTVLIAHVTGEFTYTTAKNLSTQGGQKTVTEKLDYTLYLVLENGRWMVFDFAIA